MVDYYNPNQENKDPIALIVFKIFAAFLIAVEIVFIMKPILETVFGLVACTGCSSITSVFVVTVVPIAAVFICIYSLISVFISKIEGR